MPQVNFFPKRNPRILKRFGPKSNLPRGWQVTLLRSPDYPPATDDKPERALQSSVLLSP